jgi:molybdopterin biosynthesis enzyme
MIRTMLGVSTIHRPSVKAKLEKAITSTPGARSYVRAILSEDASSVRALDIQDEISTLSDANSFIALSEKDEKIAAGASVNVVVLERRYI